MGEHYGIWSVLPPLLAILLAMLTRRVIPSLLMGVFAAALVLTDGNPFAAVVRCITTDLISSLRDPDHVRVFAFTLLMGAMVGVIHRSGGMRGLVDLLRPFATNRRRGQVITWLMGLIIFFDDYANTLLLGTTFRPVTDRLKISREKLAYIVDSTAAPVAGIAIVSTWVAGEVDFISTGLADIDIPTSQGLGFSIFIETIVYRFYPLLALMLVGMVACTGRDFGPMRKAEKQAIDNFTENEMDNRETSGRRELVSGGRVHLALVPIVVLTAVLVAALVLTGLPDGSGGTSLWQIIGSADAYSALVWASLAGCLTAMLLTGLEQRGSLADIFRAAMRGAWQMFPALVVLWLAWTLAELSASSEATDPAGRLGTAVYLASLLGDAVSPEWMPTLVFLLSAVVSYCTGTSWGTMSLLTPLVIRVTWQLIDPTGEEMVHNPIFLASIGAVLAGSIFGDHCSPISDTTILSSRASGCDHMAHVWTQMPYALVVGAVSILAGTIPVGFGISVWICLPASVLLLFGFLRCFGRRAEEDSTAVQNRLTD